MGYANLTIFATLNKSKISTEVTILTIKNILGSTKRKRITEIALRNSVNRPLTKQANQKSSTHRVVAITTIKHEGLFDIDYAMEWNNSLMARGNLGGSSFPFPRAHSSDGTVDSTDSSLDSLLDILEFR